MTESKRIVVLGGGFAGVYAVMALERALGKRSGVSITLVSRDNYFLFTPMLHEVAASDLDTTHIVNPIRKLLRFADFFQGEVQAIDLRARTVHVRHGVEDPHGHDLPFDHLVLALGSHTNFFGTPGAAELCFPMRSLGDALALRNRVLTSLEEADSECCTATRRALLNFAVTGGGFAGVETIGAMHDYVRSSLRFYPNLAPEDVRMVLVHSGPALLPELDARLGRYAEQKLRSRGVEVRLDTKVAGVDEQGVLLSDGERLPCRTLVWAAGNAPHALIGTLPCGKQRGRILVDEYLQVPGFDGIWALGDCALVPDRRTGGFHPPTAQHATRQAKTLARNLASSLGRGRKRPFSFRTLGQLATIGHRAGVAQVFGMRFSGFVAWWLWRSIYLSKLPRLERKVRVAIDWTLDLFFSKDLVLSPNGGGPPLGTTRARAAAEPLATAQT
ncbi:MAG TPA: NAD(P)/FAD-dependent oxidoreductase [Planctomycetota bacterium]|nr:NAD(P)/FAD-dependent oxidoreductase [Planctomycetota bacterium]